MSTAILKSNRLVLLLTNSIRKTGYSVSNLSTLRYTLDNPILSGRDREEYEKNGFFVVRKLVSADALEPFKKRFEEICSQKLRLPGMTVMKDVAIAKSEFLEGEKAITKIQDFCYDDELFKYCCLPEIVQYVKAFVGQNVMAMHTMLINKPPGVDFIFILITFLYFLFIIKTLAQKHHVIHCTKIFTIFRFDLRIELFVLGQQWRQLIVLMDV